MCNKYEKYSRVNEYEKHDLVDKYNKAMDDFDFEKEQKLGTSICLKCIFTCNGCNFGDSKCLNFAKSFSTKEYWDMIKDHQDQVDLDSLCKLYGLSKNHLLSMLNNKIPMDTYYAVCLNARLFEVEEFEPYL